MTSVYEVDSPLSVKGDIGAHPDDPTSVLEAIERAAFGYKEYPRGGRVQPQMSWDGSAHANEDTYVVKLTESQEQEIQKALQYFYSLGLNGSEVSQDNFPLPSLGPQLTALAGDLYEGKGFFVLRGLDPEAFFMEDNIVIFLGLSSYVGEQRGRQTDDGKVFAHIQNSTVQQVSQDARPLKYSNREAEFHNDIGSEILAMHTRSVSASGGNQLLASSAKILQVIRANRPDLADELLQPNWPMDIRRRWSTTTYQPLFYQRGARVLSTLFPDALQPVPEVPRAAGLAELTPAQLEALRLVQAVAARHCVSLCAQPGDFTFINNLGIVHGRDAFVDEGQDRRYLVRLWLRSKRRTWELPGAMREANWMVFDDDLLEEVYNISPLDEFKFQVYERITP